MHLRTSTSARLRPALATLAAATAIAVTATTAIAMAAPADAVGPAGTAGVRGRALTAAASVTTLPWHSHREGYLDQVTQDTSALGTLVSTRCNGGAPVYATSLTTWTPSVSTSVYLEQVTTTQLGRDTFGEFNGLAVLRADGSAAVCFTARGIQRTPRLTFPAGATLRIVEFLTEENDVVGYPWTQDTVMVKATGLSVPSNDLPTSPRTITSLPFGTRVDNRLATSSPQDWRPANPPYCWGAFGAPPQVSRSVWFRYVPPVTQTVLVRTSATTATPVIAEQTATGLRWLPGSCALDDDDRPQTLVDTLVAGHTYLLEVGNWYQSITDTTLLDAIAPATINAKVAVPSRSGLAVTITSGGSLFNGVQGTVTCQAGRTFVVQGRLSEASDPDVIEPFTASGTCTGTATGWTASVDGSYSGTLNLFAVAAVTAPTGSFVVVGPATGTTTG